jgi:hypothetical protein
MKTPIRFFSGCPDGDDASKLAWMIAQPPIASWLLSIATRACSDGVPTVFSGNGRPRVNEAFVLPFLRTVVPDEKSAKSQSAVIRAIQSKWPMPESTAIGVFNRLVASGALMRVAVPEFAPAKRMWCASAMEEVQ